MFINKFSNTTDTDNCKWKSRNICFNMINTTKTRKHCVVEDNFTQIGRLYNIKFFCLLRRLWLSTSKIKIFVVSVAIILLILFCSIILIESWMDMKIKLNFAFFILFHVFYCKICATIQNKLHSIATVLIIHLYAYIEFHFIV